MDRRQFTLLNLVLFFLMSGWISIHPSIAGMNSGAGWGLAWFITLYFSAAWFRLYARPSGKKVVKLAAFFAIPAVMVAGMVVTRQGGIVKTIIANWYRYDSAPVYLATLCLFSAMLNVRITNARLARWIAGIAPLTFGVYLIHAHADFSPWSWEFLNLPQYMNSVLFPLIQTGAVLGIFALCIVIDQIRVRIIGRTEARLVRKIMSVRIGQSLQRIWDAID